MISKEEQRTLGRAGKGKQGGERKEEAGRSMPLLTEVHS